MDDLISRQAAIKAIEDLTDCYNGFSDTYDKACIIGVLEELPSAQPEQRWIPVSERLPEAYDEYMITWVTSYSPRKRFIDFAEYEITSEYDYDNGRFKGEWLLGEDIKRYPDVRVIAWMPLPEAYKEDTNDN